MPNLFIYTLGPVQDFIATAKRCRDLWFGSWLLSELSKAAAKALAGECELDALIFPAPRKAEELDPASAMSVANKIVALLPDDRAPATIADRMTVGVRARLHALRDEAFRDKPSFDRALADMQLEDLIETQWVSVPIDPSQGYAAARRRGEALLAAAKNTRLWCQPPWPTGSQPKSSLDGLRESVLDEALYRGRPHEHQGKRGLFRVSEAERLCGVGLLKRHGSRRDGPDKDSDEGHDHLFFSTPHLAALPTLERINNLPSELKAKARELWEDYLAILDGHGAELDHTVHPQWRDPFLDGHDGQLLFESRISERLAHLPEEEQRPALDEALPALRKLLKLTGTPLPYIAILVADGDHIGAAIERVATVEAHKDLSMALDDFARNAREILRDHSGELIYAGGDDVLAFVPLHRTIECARALADDFRSKLGEYGDDEPPTLSVGISICHFMDPMTRSLEAAREAEKLAKRDRNSLAIVLHKRSGPAVESVGGWDEKVDQTLREFIDLHLEEAIPEKLAHDLAGLARLRQSPGPERQAQLDAIVHAEFYRTLARKRAKRGSQDLTEETMRHLEPNDPELISRLLISKILADAASLATAPKEVEP